MSVEAITWALSQPVERSSAKFVLVAMANCANNDMTCWPSVQYLSDATAQDRKTVLENIRRLKESGHIEATEERRGTTGQVVVYRLIKEAQKRNSSENGTVPKTEAKSPVFPRKESRFSVETGPKTGHGTVNEPSIEPSGKQKKTEQVSLVALVADGLTPETAAEWLAHRSRKRALLTPRAWADVKAEAAKAGWALEAAVCKALGRGWTGLEAAWLAKESAPQGFTKTAPVSKQAALEARNAAVVQSLMQKRLAHESR